VDTRLYVPAEAGVAISSPLAASRRDPAAKNFLLFMIADSSLGMLISRQHQDGRKWSNVLDRQAISVSMT